MINFNLNDANVHYFWTHKSDGISIDISDQVSFFSQGKISVPCYFIEIKGNLVTTSAIAKHME